MKITKLIATTGAACVLFASPVLAQSSATTAGDYAKETVPSENPVIPKNAPQTNLPTRTLPKLTSSTTKSQLQKPDDDTAYYFPEGFKPTPGLKTAPSSLPGPSPKYTPSGAPRGASSLGFACPSGTTAQADGTCLITGNYKG